MSRGGVCKNFAWSERQRGNKPGDVNAWKTIIKELPAVSERLQGVYILSEKALDVIYAFNAPNVLLYCDPPYLPETRTSTDSYGEYEMTAEEHDTLAQMLLKFRGKVIISGYPSVLYKRLYKDWRCVKKNIANHASQAKVKEDRTEVLWMNY
jgi:DNA adenine methylase